MIELIIRFDRHPLFTWMYRDKVAQTFVTEKIVLSRKHQQRWAIDIEECRLTALNRAEDFSRKCCREPMLMSGTQRFHDPRAKIGVCWRNRV